MPGNYIKGRMIYLIREEFTTIFINDSPIIACVFIPSHWSLKMHWICKTICSDWSKIRKNKMRFICFTNKSASLLSLFLRLQVNFKFDTSLNYTNFLRFDSHSSQLSGNIKCSFLRHYKKVSI